ncbi:hypothetical protein H8A05_11310, partial [Neisseria meningitidis]|nr:hypothetical protein [Neisseria meningitidis]
AAAAYRARPTILSRAVSAVRFFVAGAVRRGQRLFARSFPPFVILATFRHSREGGNPETPAAVIPAQAGIQSVRFQPFPIDSCRVWGLDSRFRGNDEEWQDWRGIGFGGLAARPVSVGSLGSAG